MTHAPTPFEQAEFLDRLKAACDRKTFEAAVCDMLGRKYLDDDGRIKTITVFSPLSVRYELRSRQHVEVYDFDTICTNYAE